MEPSKPFTKSSSRFLTSLFVTILVGQGETPFYIHRDLLCDRSAHFRAALKGHFKEAKTGQIAFPEEQAETFDLFVYWVYRDTLPHIHKGEDLQYYISLMSFARSILLEELYNNCMDIVRNHFYFSRRAANKDGPIVTVDDISMVYNAPEKLSKLRFCVCFEAALHVAINANNGSPGWMDSNLARLLEQGGDFASDFPRLLVYCSTIKSQLPFEASSKPEGESSKVSDGLARTRLIQPDDDTTSTKSSKGKKPAAPFRSLRIMIFLPVNSFRY
ncbi:MAG: hypothetical protein Q9166_001962 [cf. Caloplaca sp. 2 TL-2023]